MWLVWTCCVQTKCMYSPLRVNRPASLSSFSRLSSPPETVLVGQVCVQVSTTFTESSRNRLPNVTLQSWLP